MALKGAARDLNIRRFITSPTEHPCVLKTLGTLEKESGIQVEFLNVDNKGRIDPNQLEEVLASDSKKTLVSLMHGNNEIGTMIDLDEIASVVKKYHAYFHSDTVQTVGHFDFNLEATPVDFISGGGHKFHGPKGCGIIYIRQGTLLNPLLDGGSQERNMRGGTENVYGIVGFAKAMEIAYKNLDSERKFITDLRAYLKARLITHFNDIRFNGDPEGNSLYTVLNVSFPASEKSELLLLSLDIAGISASGGSACSSGAETGSHVLTEIGADPSRKAIRFSLSSFNTKTEVDFVISKLKSILPAK
jgi:cysteine desulfurase